MQKNGIAILGGTFDPIHDGHITIANWIVRHLPYTKVHIIPCYRPPYGKIPIASPQQRLDMVKLAISTNEKNLIANACEIDRKGYSYTIDTLKQLYHRLNNTCLLLVVGSDVFLTLNQWHHLEEVTALAQLMVVPRPGDSIDDIKTIGKELHLSYLTENDYFEQTINTYLIARIKPIVFSSTRIRQSLLEKKDPIGLPTKVKKYIMQQHLYQGK